MPEGASLRRAAGCGWEDTKYLCTQDLPAELPQPPTVCALFQTIDCGSGGTTEPTCDSTCSITPGSSDYPGLGCLTSYGNEVGVGTTCDEAFADLGA